MQLWSNLNTLWLLCVISMLGIIGMLVVDVIWDIVLLIVTALPMIIAVYRMKKLKGKQSAQNKKAQVLLTQTSQLKSKKYRMLIN